MNVLLITALETEMSHSEFFFLISHVKKKIKHFMTFKCAEVFIYV